jgi:organic radical activating enzyme
MDWEVKIGGIGPIIERFIIKEIAAGLDASACFVEEWRKSPGKVSGQVPGPIGISISSQAEGATEARPRAAKLHQTAAEYNLTEHCNLKCAGCNHASHQLPKKFAVLTECQRDLMALAQVLQLDELKFVGGEPLLHPELPEFLRMARAVGIADQITLVTNGVLLPKMPEFIYSLIDRLWISDYPSVKLQLDLQRIESLCQEHDVVLWHKPTPTFQLSLINHKLQDAALVQEIYSQCGYAHLWSCHTIHEGRYYKCSPAPFIPARLALAGIPYVAAKTDSVVLNENPNLHAELAAYLADEKPLSACSHCLAQLGRDIPSRQLNKAELARELKEDHTELISLFHPERVPKTLRSAR